MCLNTRFPKVSVFSSAYPTISVIKRNAIKTIYLQEKGVDFRKSDGNINDQKEF